ncbi:hypothetical protein KIN20_023105 [Parelaphostrongylus tenuis]|uniref:7TM GPCR serpentine receptor class x (Srx) domain-containing protein n=1 Tax=Parelaphostrongylus tenuis TaxID=148309 RepID=A0AAD5N9T7_PARTN|nr:hypothetical protein KIN20_023105 [Parelaphostrongylus tenuis]
MSSLLPTSFHVRTENITVSAIMAVVGVLGLISNGTAVLALRYSPALQNSFGQLCFSHIIANMCSLLIFVFWITPVTLL